MILKDAHQMIEMLSSHFNYWIIYSCVCVCVGGGGGGGDFFV